MAHHKRKRARILSSAGRMPRERVARIESRGEAYHWLRQTPMAWNICFHLRPIRRAERRLERRVLAGEDADAFVWPMHRKPHVYYW